MKFPLIRPNELQGLAWVLNAGQQDGAFISIASFASLGLEAALFDLAGRSPDQSLHLGQPQAVHDGDVQPIETWLANWKDPADDSFGFFYADGDASSGVSSASP